MASGPTRPLLRKCFYSGTAEHPIYVDHVAPAGAITGSPVIMLHGGGHTGACYLTTPDGRCGWADYFAAAGHPVYVPDWPGHGRSAPRKDFGRLSGYDVADSLAPLIEELGRVIIVAHSAGGPVAWVLCERFPGLIGAIVGVAPGAPANIVPRLPDDPQHVAALRFNETAGCPVYNSDGTTVWIDAPFIANYWSNSRRFPHAAFENYRRSIVPESARIMNERFNIGGVGLRIDAPEVVGDRPILVITGSMDPRHPRAVDEATAAYLGADFIWLPDYGINGNGHMLMMEDNSDEIAAVVLAWLARRLPK